MKQYLLETLRLVYRFWFLPLTLHKELNELAGGANPVDKNLITILRNREQYIALFLNQMLWRTYRQIVLGNFLLLVLGNILVTWLVDNSNLTIWLGGLESYWERIAISIMLGVAIGIVVGVTRSVALGIALSVSVGIMFTVALSVSGATVGIVVGSTALGIAIGVAEGVAKGIVLDIGLGTIIGITFGIIFGVILSIVEGSVEGVLLGIVINFLIILTWLKLFRAPIWITWSLLQWGFSQQHCMYAKFAFQYSAIVYDELIYIPLPFFDHFLVACIRCNPEQAPNILAKTAASLGQKWALGLGVVQWVVLSGKSVTTLTQLSQSAQRSNDAAEIIVDLPRKNGKIGNLLRDFAAVAGSLANIEKAYTVTVAQRVLDRNRAELDTLLIRANSLGRPELGDMAVHWQQLIREHAEQLENQPRSVLRGAYQAGSALETASALFRGRDDLFALGSEVYADPDRAETLLLVAQQRMGKSSALMQFSAQLPDAHVVIVDCQRAVTGRGDAAFAIGLSSAINNFGKRRPGGLRQQPLVVERVGKSPLQQLDRWLEQYADKARNKRILLCLDEFDKLMRFVAEGRLSKDVLALLRGLSQAPGWMVLYSGQFELDDWGIEYAEYLKNVRRVRVSYLHEAEGRDLIEHPVPDFALTWESAATDAAIRWTGCQPYLLQMLGTKIIDRLSPTERRTVTAADVEAIIPDIFDAGRYYFQSLQGAFSDVENRALHQLATTGTIDASPATLRRLVDHEYLRGNARDGWTFRVPLLREWWRMVEL